MIWRASLAVAMGLPSSETATIPASRMAAISAMASPLLPTLAAPMGQTRTWPCALARSTMKRVMEALSLTGLVLGMQQTAVKPPARGGFRARLDSFGIFLPRFAQVHVHVDETGRDDQAGGVEDFRVFGTRDFSPAERFQRSARRRGEHREPRRFWRRGSRTRPFLMRSMIRVPWFCVGLAFERGMRALGSAEHEEIKDCHTHGDAVGDLFEHSGLRAVGDFRRDFDAAIDGAGMQDQRVGLGKSHAFGVELVEKDVVALREGRLVEAFSLHAQNDDDVGVFERFFNAIDATDGSAGSDLFEFAGNPHGGAAESEAATEFAKQMNVGAGDAGVSDVAKDGDIEIVERALAVANGKCVEEAL